jgi:hypothetical protein
MSLIELLDYPLLSEVYGEHRRPLFGTITNFYFSGLK